MIDRPAAQAPVPEPTDRDRMWGAGVHVASIIAPFWGPVVSLLVARGRSEFALRHSWAALRETLIITGCIVVWVVTGGILTLTRLIDAWQNGWETLDWQALLIRFVIGWVLVGLLGLATTVVSVFQAIRAYRGKSPRGRVPRFLGGRR